MDRKPVDILGAALLAGLLGWTGRWLHFEVADIGRVSGHCPERQSERTREPESSYSIGVVSRFGPARTYETYQPLMDHLSGTERVAAPQPAAAGPAQRAATPYPPDARLIEQKDREIILWALEQTRFNASSAARILEIPRSTLGSKMGKYAIGQGEPAS